jgi:hypothetical protein
MADPPPRWRWLRIQPAFISRVDVTYAAQPTHNNVCPFRLSLSLSLRQQDGAIGRRNLTIP